MDVSAWTDRAAIEAWLRGEAERPDDALDLAAMALALAALARPGLDARPYAAHLDALAADAEESAAPGLDPPEQAAALAAVLFARAGYRGDRETYDDLANADLTGVNLSGADLSGANLSGANLTGAEMWATVMRGGPPPLPAVPVRSVSVVASAVQVPAAPPRWARCRRACGSTSR